LKPSNILFKNGIVKISEVNCYSHSEESSADAAAQANHAVAPVLRHSVSLRNLGASGLLPSGSEAARRTLAALQQAEFAPLLTAEYMSEVSAAASLASAGGTAADHHSPVLSSTLSADGRQRLLSLVREMSAPTTSVRSGKLVEAAIEATPAAPLPTSAATTSPRIQPCIDDFQSLGSSPLHAHASAASDRLYHLMSYGDSFACGCLAYFILTLGQHPFGTTTTSLSSLGTASVTIARRGAPAVASLSAALLSASLAAADATCKLVALMQEGRADESDLALLAPVASDSSSSSSSVGGSPPPGAYLAAARRSAGAAVAVATPTSVARAVVAKTTPAAVAKLSADSLDYEEAADLVSRLLSSDAGTRLTPAAALNHPFFWRVSQKFLLIALISESTVVQQDRTSGEHAAFAATFNSVFRSAS
jgi:serine/threonine protein kinase